MRRLGARGDGGAGRVAQPSAGDGKERTIDFRDTPEEARFRAGVSSFIEQELPDELRLRGPFSDSFDLGEDRSPAMKTWWKRLADKGWLAPA